MVSSAYILLHTQLDCLVPRCPGSQTADVVFRFSPSKYNSAKGGGRASNAWLLSSSVLQHSHLFQRPSNALSMKYVLSITEQTHEKTDVNLFFTITNGQIVRSRWLPHRINYKFMCLSASWR